MHPEDIFRLQVVMTLTPKQKRLWLEIARMLLNDEYITLRILMRNLGYKSQNQIFNLLKALAEKGYLKPRPFSSAGAWRLFIWPLLDEVRRYANDRR